MALCGRADVAFEFFTKLGVEYWAFHDIDLAPEGSNMHEVSAALVSLSISDAVDVTCRFWGTGVR